MSPGQGYSTASSAWGGDATPMTQYGAGQPPMRGQYAGAPPVSQGWKEPNAPSPPGAGVQERPLEFRHELQT
jgi:hypothetical protein